MPYGLSEEMTKMHAKNID